MKEKPLKELLGYAAKIYLQALDCIQYSKEEAFLHLRGQNVLNIIERKKKELKNEKSIYNRKR